jgi:HlyD family secretion protein
LQGSEQVITTGSYGIDPGTKVKVGKADDDKGGDDAGGKGGEDK